MGPFYTTFSCLCPQICLNQQNSTIKCHDGRWFDKWLTKTLKNWIFSRCLSFFLQQKHHHNYVGRVLFFSFCFKYSSEKLSRNRNNIFPHSSLELERKNQGNLKLLCDLFMSAFVKFLIFLLCVFVSLSTVRRIKHWTVFGVKNDLNTNKVHFFRTFFTLMSFCCLCFFDEPWLFIFLFYFTFFVSQN